MCNYVTYDNMILLLQVQRGMDNWEEAMMVFGIVVNMLIDIVIDNKQRGEDMVIDTADMNMTDMIVDFLSQEVQFKFSHCH